MPIDETMITPDHGLDVPVKAGRLCGGCGYVLTGLKVGMACPECGKTIGPNKRSTTRDDVMTAVDHVYLSRLRLAALGLGCSAPFMFIGSVVAALASGLVGLAVVLLGAAMWLAGVLVVTGPKPMRPGLTEHPSEEMKRTRDLARLSQLGWAAVVPAWLVATWGPGFSAGLFEVLAELALLIAVVGTIPLCLWLSDLSDWGRDHQLGRRFTTSAFLIALFALSAVASMVNIFGISNVIGGFLSVVSFWANLLGLVGIVIFFVSALQFAALVQNAMSSAAIAAGRAERLRLKKLEADQRQHDQPGEIRRPAGQILPCKECGYDLTGLPNEARCPECGTENWHRGPGTTGPRIAPPPKLDTTPIPMDDRANQPSEASRARPTPDAPPPTPGTPSRHSDVERPGDVEPYDLADD